MTVTARHRAAPGAPVRTRAARGRGTVRVILVTVVAILGVLVLLYPTAARWFSDRNQASEVTGYVEAVEGVPDAARSAMLESAHAYNTALPRGPLRNPFRPDGVAQETAVGEFTAEYFAQLSFEGSQSMARLTIPAIDVDLPVMHGTDDETLARGVGHLFGSSLPVGGASTHAVLTSHSGFVNATLFNDLNQLVEGDTFAVSVLGETLWYQVDQIRTVLPDESEDLVVVDGKDYVTLVTCTPTGVNSHRLLVRGVRLDDVAVAETAVESLPGRGQAPGFPWWVLGVGVAALLVPAVPRLSRRRSSPSV